MSKELSFIHVKNIEKFHPGYKDRKLHWMKMYFDMVQGDPEFEMIESEIDKWRFICIVVLELQAQKPLPVDDEYFRRKGFDTKKRPISLTLKMLHNFLDTVTQLSKVCAIEESRVEENKSRIRKEEKSVYVFDNPPSEQDVYLYMLGFSNEKKIGLKPEAIKVIATQWHNHYSSEDCNWTYMAGGTKKTKMKDWKAKCRDWILREKKK